MSGNCSPLTVYRGGPARLTSDSPQFRHGVILTSWRNIIKLATVRSSKNQLLSQEYKGAQLQFFTQTNDIHTRQLNYCNHTNYMLRNEYQP